MWVCAKCGEPHQDQFKECWNCVGAEMNEHVTATPPRPRPAHAPERRLRPLKSILVRAVIAFFIGVVLGLSSLNFISVRSLLPDELIVSSTDRFVLALIFGASLGSLVGVFIWVVFPYEPLSESNERSADLTD